MVESKATYSERFLQVDINMINDGLSQWLHSNPAVSQASFSKNILQQQPNILSELLKSCTVPRSSQEEQMWLKIRDFLHDDKQQQRLLGFCK